MNLETIIRQSRGTVFLEDHGDPDLVAKLDKIYAAAARAGVKDAVLEMPPHVQPYLDQSVGEYKRMKRAGADLDMEMDKIGFDVPEVKILLAAKYGMNVHAVDMGPRADMMIFTMAQQGLADYRRTHANAGMKDYLAALKPADLDDYAAAAGFPVSRERIDAVSKTPGGRDALGRRRVMEGDGKTADKIEERVGQRPFIGFFGYQHSGEVDENSNGYASADLDGALRLKFGESQIKTVLMTNAAPASQKPDAIMNDDGSLRFGGRRMAPLLLPQQRMEACQRIQIKCGP